MGFSQLTHTQLKVFSHFPGSLLVIYSMVNSGRAANRSSFVIFPCLSILAGVTDRSKIVESRPNRHHHLDSLSPENQTAL